MSIQAISESILNFRKLRHDFSPAILKQGKALFEKGGCFGAKIASYTAEVVVVEAKVMGHFNDIHDCSVEIGRMESELVYSTCDCSQEVDCLHLACLLFYLEKHFHAMLLTFLGEMEDEGCSPVKKEIKQVKQKLEDKAERERARQLVADYSHAGQWLATSSLFRPEKECTEIAELMLLIGPLNGFNGKYTEIQLAVKLLNRPKPVLIQQPRIFLLALQQLEPLVLGSQRVVLSDDSFGDLCRTMITFLRREFEYFEKSDRVTRGAYLQLSRVFILLSLAAQCRALEGERLSAFIGTFDTPLVFSDVKVRPSFTVEVLKDPDERLVIKPYFDLPEGRAGLNDVKLVLASPPGLLSGNTYYSLAEPFTQRHAVDLDNIDHYVVPKELFSSFLTYGLPNIQRFGEVNLPKSLVTPSAQYLVDPKAVCHADLKNGELRVRLAFQYMGVQIPEVRLEHTLRQISSLSKGKQAIPRNFMRETQLSQELLWGLTPGEKEGVYCTRSEKRIIDFVSDTITSLGDSVDCHLSPSMKRCFTFDKSKITLTISETENQGTVRCQLSCEGPLSGIPVSKVVEAARFKRSYIETGRSEAGVFPKRVIVSTQEEVEALSHVIEDFSIPAFKKGAWMIPLWSVIGIEDGATISSQVTVVCSEGIAKMRQDLANPKADLQFSTPQRWQKILHPYQKDGVQWLRRLRDFGLAGILADDMGIGKTVQAICLLAEAHRSGTKTAPSLIVCPTSLVDNWKEELNRFEPGLKVVTYVGAPTERRKLLKQRSNVDVYVTSYGLVQRDLELFESFTFTYVILDEAQAIKNRETRNARSVKQLNAFYRLVLTGTPVENSLDDLWSLFDFLMPGFLGSHERFTQMYMRSNAHEKALDFLKKRIAPFVLRRMKQDVLEDLPPISHETYHCYLHDEQRTIYQKAAKQAKEELQNLVETKGFDKARLHVLATLTRLKQICCHPSLVSEENEAGSAKYEMLRDLLGSLLETGHKTVLFSQYTKMLSIIRDDLDKEGIPYYYLDGATKNRQALVRSFNKDDTPIFLISLRAGGQGLNLVGADSVIHYDMWWNPAVEEQARDRVWRLGQKTKVSSYKLVTKGTIEEKIVEMQERKKDLISDLVECDDDVLSKLTWDDVLTLLRT